ncbi:MAG: Spo0B domain-containing protein [Syntrophothermaceae bacterium]
MKAEDMIQLLRRQRHEFLNRIQVVSGYLQLGYPARAGKYLQELAADMELDRELLVGFAPEVSLLLFAHRLQGREIGILIKFRKIDVRPDLDVEIIGPASLRRMRNLLEDITRDDQNLSVVEASILMAEDRVVFRVYLPGEGEREFTLTGGEPDVC